MLITLDNQFKGNGTKPAQNTTQPDQADGEEPAVQANDIVEADRKNNGGGNTEVKPEGLEDVEYKYELNEDNYTKIDSFDKNNKVIKVIDTGAPRDVSGECQYGETNTENLPSTITMTDSNNKHPYKYEYIGKTKEGCPVYGTPNRTQKYILVNGNGEYVLYQPESFTGYDEPDNQLKTT